MTLSNIGTQSTASDFPATLQAKIDACPGAGGGLHPELSRVANELRHCVDAARGFEVLRDIAIERGRPEHIANREARELIKQKWNGGPATRADRTAVETKANVELIRDIVAKGDGGLAELRDQSPIKVDAADDGAADDIINLLFPDGDIIYVGKSECKGMARTHSELYARGIKLREWSHIVPNPMKERFVYDADGKTIFPRRMSNVAYRRWLVLDFDTAKFGRDGKTPTFWKPLIESWELQWITPKDAQSRSNSVFIQLRVSPRNGRRYRRKIPSLMVRGCRRDRRRA